MVCASVLQSEATRIPAKQSVTCDIPVASGPRSGNQHVSFETIRTSYASYQLLLDALSSGGSGGGDSHVIRGIQIASASLPRVRRTLVSKRVCARHTNCFVAPGHYKFVVVEKESAHVIQIASTSCKVWRNSSAKRVCARHTNCFACSG